MYIYTDLHLLSYSHVHTFNTSKMLTTLTERQFVISVSTYIISVCPQYATFSGFVRCTYIAQFNLRDNDVEYITTYLIDKRLPA